MIFNIIGVILTGGKSIRMGNNKFNLKYKNKFFIYRSTILLIFITKNIIISINFKKQEILNIYLIKEDIKNKIMQNGPLNAIYTNMQFIPFKVLNIFYIVLPIDMPLLQKYFLYTIYLNISLHYSIIYFYKYPLPILIKFSPSLSNYLNNIMQNKESLKNFIKNMKFILTLNILKKNKFFFSNINNPYDLYKLIKMDSL